MVGNVGKVGCRCLSNILGISPGRAVSVLKLRGDWPVLRTLTAEEADSDFHVLAAFARRMHCLQCYAEGTICQNTLRYLERQARGYHRSVPNQAAERV